TQYFLEPPIDTKPSTFQPVLRYVRSRRSGAELQICHSGFSLSPPQLPRPAANQVCDSCDRFHHHSLRQAACLADSRFADQDPHFPRSTGSGALAQRADLTVNAGCRRNILITSWQLGSEIRDENKTRCT